MAYLERWKIRIRAERENIKPQNKAYYLKSIMKTYPIFSPKYVTLFLSLSIKYVAPPLPY